MERIYGVSSVIPANQKLKNGYTMYDWVMRQRCFPAFWCRTLIGKNAITTEEVSFLNAKECKIAFMIRDLNEINISGIDGSGDAMRAVAAAKELGIPQNNTVALFAEINPKWSINHNWMLSFAYTLDRNGYVPGFIGNTDSSMNFNFDRQSSHYVQALGETKPFETIFGATEPKVNGEPDEWCPYCPSALDPADMSIWVCGCLAFDHYIVEDTYLNNKKTLSYMW